MTGIAGIAQVLLLGFRFLPGTRHKYLRASVMERGLQNRKLHKCPKIYHGCYREAEDMSGECQCEMFHRHRASKVLCELIHAEGGLSVTDFGQEEAKKHMLNISVGKPPQTFLIGYTSAVIKPNVGVRLPKNVQHVCRPNKRNIFHTESSQGFENLNFANEYFIGRGLGKSRYLARTISAQYFHGKTASTSHR